MAEQAEYRRDSDYRALLRLKKRFRPVRQAYRCLSYKTNALECEKRGCGRRYEEVSVGYSRRASVLFYQLVLNDVMGNLCVSPNAHLLQNSRAIGADGFDAPRQQPGYF